MFSLYVTQALSHIILIPQNLSLSLSIFRPITSTHASRILHFDQNWSKQPERSKTHHSPEQAEIWSEVEQGGQLFQFICRYEIFRPFQSEWNKINNNKLNYSSTSNCLQFNYWLRAGLEEIKLQLLPQCYL